MCVRTPCHPWPEESCGIWKRLVTSKGKKVAQVHGQKTSLADASPITSYSWYSRETKSSYHLSDPLYRRGLRIFRGNKKEVQLGRTMSFRTGQAPEGQHDLGRPQQRPTQPLVTGWHWTRQDQRPIEGVPLQKIACQVHGFCEPPTTSLFVDLNENLSVGK